MKTLLCAILLAAGLSAAPPTVTVIQYTHPLPSYVAMDEPFTPSVQIFVQPNDQTSDAFRVELVYSDESGNTKSAVQFTPRMYSPFPNHNLASLCVFNLSGITVQKVVVTPLASSGKQAITTDISVN